MNLDGSNDSDLQNMSLNGDQSQPAHQSIWKKLDEIMEILYHILRPVLLVLVIIATHPKVFRNSFSWSKLQNSMDFDLCFFCCNHCTSNHCSSNMDLADVESWF